MMKVTKADITKSEEVTLYYKKSITQQTQNV